MAKGRPKRSRLPPAQSGKGPGGVPVPVRGIDWTWFSYFRGYLFFPDDLTNHEMEFLNGILVEFSGHKLESSQTPTKCYL